MDSMRKGARRRRGGREREVEVEEKEPFK